MFIPIYDYNRLEHVRLQYVTLGVMAIAIFMFVFFQSGVFIDGLKANALGLGVVPSVILDQKVLPPGYGLVPENLTLVTYTFVHGDWLHLIGNMLFIWVFGDNVEDAMGHFRFLIFYVACAAGAAAFHIMMMPTSDAPLIGASGAASGIIAAYLMLHPKIRVWVLVLSKIPVPISAAWALGAWIALQFVNVMLPDDGEVAWWAHIGGLLTGAALVLVLRRPGVRLFDGNAS
ncbi:MAG: rhomboid family intramembrane serine protease [Hyphomicrobiales bacterium]|nr:MAG: rhomboid family intramembrane serine protease [Hyphomicrobiales bacterium]